MSEVSSGCVSSEQDSGAPGGSAAQRLIHEFTDLFSEAFDVSLPEGWYEITREACDAIVRVDPTARVAQLKEKFGGVRMYMNKSAHTTHTVIQELEIRSVRTCQKCGAEGKRTQKKWLVATLCEEHAK